MISQTWASRAGRGHEPRNSISAAAGWLIATVLDTLWVNLLHSPWQLQLKNHAGKYGKMTRKMSPCPKPSLPNLGNPIQGCITVMEGNTGYKISFCPWETFGLALVSVQYRSILHFSRRSPRNLKLDIGPAFRWEHEKPRPWPRVVYLGSEILQAPKPEAGNPNSNTAEADQKAGFCRRQLLTP